MSLITDIIETLDREVARLHDMQDPAPKDAALIAAEAKRLAEELDLIANESERVLAKELEERGLEDWVLVNGEQMFHVEQTTKTSTTGIQTTELVAKVLRRAAETPQADPVTGEVIHTSEVQLRELLACFRPTPRWGALYERDIHRDEYAEVRKTPWAKVTKVVGE